MGSNLIEFLTSKEILIVYLIAGIACLVCFIIYLVEKNNEKLKQRHNTRELNKLVEQIKEETYVYDDEEIEYEKPILETIEYGTDEVGSVSDLVQQTLEVSKDEEVVLNEEVEDLEEIVEIEDLVEEVQENKVEEPIIEVENLEDLNDVEFKEELIYTDIEPDKETARLELKKIEEELRKQESISDIENIALTNYEEQQEESAIISLEELLKKSKEMYEKNEITQYADEGNEPISLQDLEKQFGEKKENYDEPFIIEEVVPENSEKVEIEELIIEDTKPVVKEEKKFTISPVISPIYGLQKNTTSDLELENTADYDKLDEEIKKTNDFLTTLKDLQTKLDENN
ncbi:MAG: hypothetical protein IJ463_05980 [Bacilli bacterium]|nr:hypothetical protein [Bacilli bacterium]